MPDGPGIKQVLEDLAERDAEPLRAYLHGHGVDVEAVRALAPWNSERRADGLSHRVVEPTRATSAVPRQILDAMDGATGPDAALHRALLALFIWHECRQAWERSYQFQPILKTLDDTSTALAAQQLALGGARRTLEAAGALLELLKRQILVEDHLTVGNLSAHAEACRATVRAAEDLAERAGSAELDGALGEFLGDEGEGSRLYYAAVTEAVRATEAFLRGGRDGARRLGRAIDGLREAERDGAVQESLSEIDRSELRAHRNRLETLRRAADRPWLTVDFGRIAYLYPFGVRGIRPERLADDALRTAADWTLAGLAPVDVLSIFDVDDVFAGYDRLDRRFDGTTLVLPKLYVEGLGRGRVVELDAELRFSRLGNNYLKLTGELTGVQAHELFQALFLAAPEHGQVEVHDADGVTWPRLSSYAVSVVRSIVGEHARTNPVEPPRPDAPGVEVSVRPGMYHVVVSVLSASKGTGPNAAERTPVESAEELTGLFGGQVLLHPVPNAVGAIADWSTCQPVARRLPNFAGVADLLAYTANTTLVVMPTSPSFEVEMYATLSEFAGSLGGLYSAWRDELDEQERVVEGVIDDMARDAAPLAELVARTRGKQVELRRFASAVRSTQAVLNSPELVAAPVDAAILRALLTSTVEGAEREINAKLRVLLDDRLGSQLEAIAAAEEHESERRSRRNVEAFVAAIGAVGFAGVAKLAQDGLGLTGPRWTAAFVAGVVLAVAGIWAYRRFTGTGTAARSGKRARWHGAWRRLRAVLPGRRGGRTDGDDRDRGPG